MLKRHLVIAVVGAFVCAAALMQPATAEAQDGAELYKAKACFTCHGEDGKTSLMPEYPKIAGQNSAYALRQMLDIKAGTRANGLSPAMNAIMINVSDEEIKVLADYLATLAP